MRRDWADFIPHFCGVAILVFIALWVMATKAETERLNSLVGQPRAAAIEMLGAPHRSEVRGNIERCEWDTYIPGSTTFVNTGNVLMPISSPGYINTTVLVFRNGNCASVRKK